MKTISISALFMFFFTGVFAQYLFEKYPAITYQKIPFKTVFSERDSVKIGTANFNSYKFVVRDETERSGIDHNCFLTLYKNGKSIFRTEVAPYVLWTDFPMKIADINGDGLVDFKITYPNAGGSGLAGSRIWKIYLFNKGHDKFEKIAFGDFYSEEKDEHDFNGDGNYEIIAQHYVSHKWHAYWSFDLYNYINGRLINVSAKNNYPIMVRAFQDKETHKVPTKVSRSTMHTYSKKLPDLYQQDL